MRGYARAMQDAPRQAHASLEGLDVGVVYGRREEHGLQREENHASLRAPKRVASVKGATGRLQSSTGTPRVAPAREA